MSERFSSLFFSTTVVSDGAKMVEVGGNILQGFYGQTDEHTTLAVVQGGSLQASPPQVQEFPINFPQNENLPFQEQGAGDYIDDLAERVRSIEIELENQRELSRRNRLNNRRLRAIGLELRFLADNFLLPERHAGFIALREAISRKGVLSEEEKLIVNLIDSYTRENEELPPTIISQICQHVRNCVTSSTFRMALQYICTSSHSVPEELAAACDLASRIYPRFQDLQRANSIYNALAEFIESNFG